MRTFVKFGGSVITDKTVDEQPDLPTIAQLARDVRAALDAQPDMELILGHGSGSFGHTYARRYGVHTGLADDADWMGYALTAAAALRLNRIVVDTLLKHGVPALSLQPSAALESAAGTVTRWETAPVAQALRRRLVPVIHGDVAFDTVQGSAILSTERLLQALAANPALCPERIILVGESGIFTADPRSNPSAERIPRITSANIAQARAMTGGSHGVDVTGGMRSKLDLMWSLIQAHPTLTVHLIGPTPELLTRALTGTANGEGTLISS